MVKVFELLVDDTEWECEIELGMYSSLKQAKAVAKKIYETQPEWEYNDTVAVYIGEIPDVSNVGHNHKIRISVWELDDESTAEEYKKSYLGKS